MGTALRHQSRHRGVGSFPLVLFGVCWSLLLSGGARAETDNGVTFLYPAGGEMFYYLDTVNVTYTSSFSEPYLFTFCRKADDSIRQVRMQEATPYDGSTLVSMNFTSNYVCWFDLKPATSGGGGANSQGWTLSSNQREQTTWGLPQATATSTSPSETATSTAETSIPEERIDKKSKGLSAGAKAGIGISVTVVILGVASFFASVWWRRRKRQQQAQQQIINLANAGHFEKRPSSYGGGSYYFSVVPENWNDDHAASTSSLFPHSPQQSPQRSPQDERPHSPPGYVEDEEMLGAQQLPGFYGKDDARSDMTNLYGPATPDMPPVRPASPVLGAVELPSRDGHHGYGWEQELPDTANQPRQYVPTGREAQEQKFLLQDMLPLRQQRSPHRNGGPAG